VAGGQGGEDLPQTPDWLPGDGARCTIPRGFDAVRAVDGNTVGVDVDFWRVGGAGVVVSVIRVLVMMMSGWIALWGFTVCVCVACSVLFRRSAGGWGQFELGGDVHGTVLKAPGREGL
jgi:hypothetical protein